MADPMECSIDCLCNMLGSCKLTTFLKYTFDPHYPFKKRDWEKLFGNFSLSYMKTLGEEQWFEFKTPERLGLSLKYADCRTFYICMYNIYANSQRIVPMSAPFVLIHHGTNGLMVNFIKHHKKNGDFIFSIFGEESPTIHGLVDVLVQKCLPPAIPLAQIDAGFYRDEISLLITNFCGVTNSSFMTHHISDIGDICGDTYGDTYGEDLLEYYCARDPGAPFVNRSILKGFIVHEIFFSMISRAGRIDSDLIMARRRIDQITLLKNRFNGTNLHQWWLIGHGCMDCFPEELAGLVRMMFVRPLFI
jgi:hypothetical protein